ncbi:protein kinase domain-containing protein [Paractinoplanes globisporus]|uniref:Protein kinase n=1 Tax=Paractinoplanes globisporus TaxID=113565 RepID=A0ABW6WI88_9ACTN|nr:protein kinase [Actinoplanes globisporus]
MTSSHPWTEFLQDNGLGPYRLNDFRGGGVSGLVFEAVDSRTNRNVALKVLIPGASGVDTLEFEDEGRMLAKLTRASNVIDYFESGEEMVVVDTARGLPMPFRFHVLEVANGCLEEFVINDELRQRLPWEEKLLLWRGAAKGIHQMHLNGCVHRDIKSSNCLLVVGAQRRTECKISDLGKSRDLSTPARLPREMYLASRGDLRFAAPETLYFQGQETEKSFKLADLYGLGSLFYELGTGQGITAVALGYGPDVFNRNLGLYRAGKRIELSGLRAQYSAALALLRPELPPQIRERAMSLVAQLCDPVPEARLPRVGLGRRRSTDKSLEWLLQQSDILIRSLQNTHSKSASRSGRR